MGRALFTGLDRLRNDEVSDGEFFSDPSRLLKSTEGFGLNSNSIFHLVSRSEKSSIARLSIVFSSSFVEIETTG